MRVGSITTCAVLLGGLTACSNESSLVVQVRTDLVPGRELAAVVVEVTPPSGPARELRTEAGDVRDWGLGVRVAELGGLEAGDYSLDVRAVDATGATLVRRPARTALDGGLEVVTILLTRDCAGVECPAEHDAPSQTACLGGRCVATDCTEESTAGCGPPACVDATDCPTPEGACAQAECTASGVCTNRLDHAACADRQTCAAEVGCVAAACDGTRVGAPRALDELSVISANVYGASLAADGLEIAFTDGYDIFRATRASPADRFGDPVSDWSVSGEVTDNEPSLSPDGLRMYYTIHEAEGPVATIYVASRSSRDAGFDPGAPLPHERLALPYESGPDLSADELVLVFNASDDPEGEQHLFLATRPDRGAAFGPPEEITGLAPAGASQHYASLSADALTLYYAVGNGSDGEPIEIWVATRPSREAAFTGGARVEGLSPTAEQIADPDVSFDGTELYYNVGDASTAVIWVAPIECP